MLKFSYWNTKTKEKGSLLPVNVNGFRAINLSMDLNQAYILDLEINPALQGMWCAIADDPFAGVLMEIGDCQFAFIKSNEREERYRNGRQAIKFYSSVWSLTRSSLQNVSGYIQSNSLQQVIQEIEPEFSFVFMSGDQPVNFDSGVPLNNFELLRDICFANGWSFRENGLDSEGRTEILVGDFTDIKDFGTGRKYDAIDIISIEGSEFTPNKNSDDRVYLEDYRATYNRNFITHFYTYSVPFEGVDTGSITEFTRSSYDFVDPNYPIVQLADGKWYVQNSSAYIAIDQCTEFTRREQFQQQTSIDQIDASQQTEYDELDILEQMYNSAVTKLQRSSENISYAFVIRYLDLVLPGTCLNVKIKSSIKDYDGWTKDAFDVDEVTYARNITMNEQDLSTLIC